jgi:hypothetical protein
MMVIRCVKIHKIKHQKVHFMLTGNKIKQFNQYLHLMPVIPGIWEAEVRRIVA